MTVVSISRIEDLAALQHLGKRMANLFADAQHALGRASRRMSVGMEVSRFAGSNRCHRAHLALLRRLGYRRVRALRTARATASWLRWSTTSAKARMAGRSAKARSGTKTGRAMKQTEDMRIQGNNVRRSVSYDRRLPSACERTARWSRPLVADGFRPLGDIQRRRLAANIEVGPARSLAASGGDRIRRRAAHQAAERMSPSQRCPPIMPDDADENDAPELFPSRQFAAEHREIQRVGWRQAETVHVKRALHVFRPSPARSAC